MIDNRKKVLIACDSSRTLLDFRGKLIEELLMKNDVHVFTPKISQQHVRERLQIMNVTVHENKLNGSNVSIFSDLKYIIQLYNLIKEIKPDIFFPYTFKPVIYGTIVAKLCKIGRITPMLTGLGYNFADKTPKKRLVSTITRVLLKFSLSSSKRIRIIFQNRDDYQKLMASGIIGVKQQAFVVNGSGVDLTHYDYSPPEIKQISFLMISRLINAKGIKEFYEAAKLIRQKFSNVRFKLIGSYDDNIDSINKELYASIRSGEVIEYLGPVDDVRPYIKEASILVLPSYYGEGVPRCILEGMAMGRAIITCDSVGCRETVNTAAKQRNGFLIPIKNVAALASKMEYYLKHTKNILTYGLNGRSFAKEKFDVNLVNAEMLKIMQVD
ncbi:glycosyltransferase family 4 protein [Pedobacter hiemivivus]|uniref:Glycosyltransferase family 4 protein n=1 Tax=Pedobacter hiemivivus TaxID=2530454 RepID=A0A4V5PEM5_9SPHI|nr:glycosyltransferase family 4 protein [Pedobacter hiemivivus]TKC56226.1 glycosyltransferase family 4 protein [Pedobacter hiemivivus]